MIVGVSKLDAIFIELLNVFWIVKDAMFEHEPKRQGVLLLKTTLFGPLTMTYNLEYLCHIKKLNHIKNSNSSLHKFSSLLTDLDLEIDRWL